jgi:hypothetical protein
MSSKFILILAKTNYKHLAEVKDFTSTLAAPWEKFGITAIKFGKHPPKGFIIDCRSIIRSIR